jgi:hemoglobin
MENTLYQEIGEVNIQVLVHRFYEGVFSSPKIAHLFETDQDLIKDKQFKFLSQFLGGPNLYTEEYGAPKMRRRHMAHVITQESKEEWMRCMTEAVNGLEIDEKLKIKLLKAFPVLAQHMVNR